MRTEKWVETRLWFTRFDQECYRRLLLTFIKPVIKELEKNGSIETFHFFFEPYLSFRILPTTEEKIDDVETAVKNHLKEISDFIDLKRAQEPFVDYLGEANDYGEDGWLITKKFFECCSRMAIGRVNPEFKKKKQFNEGKFVHCFLNQWGYNILREAFFHQGGSLERTVVWLSLQLESFDEKLKKIEERIAKLEAEKET